METSKIEFTRVNNDINGNPRYVCHFSNLSKDQDRIDFNAKFPGNITSVNHLYNEALNRAKQIGGRKFHNKQYGGGIVFQSYNIADTEKGILELLK
jgi:hypothetical protein